MARRAAAVLLMGLFTAGCGGSGSRPPSRPAQVPQPIEAERIVDAFLYAPPNPASVCPRLWVAAAGSQAHCAVALRRLKIARARHVFAPPKRGTIAYRLDGVAGSTVQIEAGDRQPDPSKGPPTFYGVFDLQRVGGGWRIAAVSPSPRA